MAYRMLAFDYDETLAVDGAIQPPAGEALAEAKAAGWRLALVTGRPHEDLLERCPLVGLFDVVVDENGAVLYLPAAGMVEELVERPDGRLRAELGRRGIPFFAGRIVTIVRRPHEADVVEIVRDGGLEVSLFHNRPAVMIVPRGTDKGTGFLEGLRRVGVAADETIAVGDDENDLAFLRLAGFRVAVANAIDAVKAEADVVTARPSGEGVAEFVRERVLGAPKSLRPR